ALSMLRLGVRVTLLDAWGPGNARASSGGETRLIRAIYGSDLIYTQMASRALDLWRENEKRWGRQLYHRTGLVWVSTGDDHGYERASIEHLRQCRIPHEVITSAEAGARFPQINFEGARSVIYENEAGYLSARVACHMVLASFIAEGGEYRQVHAKPGRISGKKLDGLELSDGTIARADKYVFACGPWMGRMFPEQIGDLVFPTRQEVFFFGTAAGDQRFNEGQMPAWVDHGSGFMYGMPGNLGSGFKVADDARGRQFDPTDGDRVP